MRVLDINDPQPYLAPKSTMRLPSEWRSEATKALTKRSPSTDDGDVTLDESLASSEVSSQTGDEAHCNLLEQRFRLDGKRFKHFLPALTHVHRIHLPLSQHKQQRDVPD